MATIALFTSNNIFSRIIQFFEGSKISHSAIGIDIDGVSYFLHAAWGGVQLTARENVLSYDKLFAEFEVIPNIEDEVNTAKSKIGEPYDTIGLFGFIFVLLARKLGIGIHNPLASKSAVVCSEFIIECDTQHLIPEFYGLDPETITPPDLFHICSNGKSFKELV